MGAKALPRLRTVLETETEALRWTKSSVSIFGNRNIIFEFDFKELVSMVKEEEEEWPCLKPIVQDIKHMLLDFEVLKLMFFPMESNNAVDRVVKESFQIMG